SSEMSSDLRMILVSCADRRMAAPSFLSANGRQAPRDIRQSHALRRHTSTGEGACPPCCDLNYNRCRSFGRTLIRKMTSPNVVPFPSVPDRALDERFERFADQYTKILRAHIARHCPRHLGIQINDIEQDRKSVV